MAGRKSSATYKDVYRHYAYLIDTGQLRSAISYLVKWAHGRETKEG